ncbi:hypothetical protein ACH41C_09505 [Streptomyces althioticus]|uniref:hypothetical protein n=1 Tax=Streptomyces althioticus TaxID=83380 RepID=UPI0037AF6FC3
MSEPTSAPALRALNSLKTSAPLLRAWADRGEATAHIAGAGGRESWSASSWARTRGRATDADVVAVERVRDALVAAGAESVTFSARIDPSGRTRLRVRVPRAAVESGPAAGVVPVDDVYVADSASRPVPWRYASCEAPVTLPDDAVQGLVGSPGLIVFGDNGGGDRLAVDLTPGPAGHTRQIVLPRGAATR